MDINHVPGVDPKLDALYSDPELRALEYELEHDARHQLLRDLVLSGEATAIEISEYNNDERPRRLIRRALEIGESRRRANPLGRRRHNPTATEKKQFLKLLKLQPAKANELYRLLKELYKYFGENAESYATGYLENSLFSELRYLLPSNVRKRTDSYRLTKEQISEEVAINLDLAIRDVKELILSDEQWRSPSKMKPSDVNKHSDTWLDDVPSSSKYVNPRRRNALDRDSDHPIEVTRHYRTGPPGYLSPWQRAASMGQNELFSTGIALSSRAADRLKSRNPGVTKAAYKAGLKEATAAQLGKLARIGLRTGHTVAEVKSNLKATGRFTAAQITRGLDQATAAEKRLNPGKGSRKTREIYEKFNGRPARKTTTTTAPNGTPKNVAKLGALRLIKTTDGRKWAFSGSGAPDLAADSRGRLHVVGGSYRANPAGEHVGEIEQIEYETKKPHLGQPKKIIYYHRLGEEGGKRPRLVIDREGLIKIHGGDYRIEADGIHD